MPRETVLFACVENAGRFADGGGALQCARRPVGRARCLGWHRAAERVHPAIAQVMRELDIELGDARRVA